MTRAAQMRQRWMILIGGSAYTLFWLWMNFRVGTPPDFARASLVLLPVTLVLYGLTYAKKQPGPLLEINPALFAAAFGHHIALSTVAAPEQATLRFALLFGILAAFVVLAAPTLRAMTAALGIVLLAAGWGAYGYSPVQEIASFVPIDALSYTVPTLVISGLMAFCLETQRREAFALKMELERRATSDNLTGVSNRAHINQLAQNEFARARRYREPFACLILEIDNYDDLARNAPHARDVVVQVFTGYCVVIMRHCDSFGRLSPARFLALLPETNGTGATILANRMCRDLSTLDVMVGGEALNFTVSIGVGERHTTDHSAGDLLRRIEQGLEDAIERGRNQAVFADPPPREPQASDPADSDS